MLETQLLVGGMTCAACVSTIENVVGSTDNVRSVSVNLITERALITHDEVLSAKDLVDLVEDVCSFLLFSLVLCALSARSCTHLVHCVCVGQNVGSVGVLCSSSRQPHRGLVFFVVFFFIVVFIFSSWGDGRHDRDGAPGGRHDVRLVCGHH